MAEAVVSIALETLRDLLAEEVRFLSGVGSQVKELQEQMKEMKCLAEDAERRKSESKTIDNWISKIRDLAYRAEDTIETYAFHVSSRRSGPRFKRLLRRFACVLSNSSTLHQIVSEISQIKSEFSTVMGSMKEYGIRSIVQGEGSTCTDNNQKWKRQTFPYDVEDCFVGKEDDVRQLVSLVIDEKEHRIISIWGMGGIGKTTIARKVYNHNDVKWSFECFAWVCVTQVCQIRSVLEDVLKQLNPGKDTNLSEFELIGQLIEIQKKKRCLIVMDDLWSIDHWYGLKQPFVVQDLNSKILLSTRKKNVADIGYAFELGLMSKNDGWKLLKMKAFPHINVQDFSIEEELLQNIGKEMVHKCGYLPLVISILGGLLSKKNSIEEWNLVNEHMNAYLYRREGTAGENEIHGVLNLNYDELPYYLKPCFLYLGQLKEDQTLTASYLYNMWMAQGMILREHIEMCESLMDVGEFYLGELASRCIVQVTLEDSSLQIKYRNVKLHDIVRELCLSQGKKEDFGLQQVNYRDGNLDTLLHDTWLGAKTRHLFLSFEKDIQVKRNRYRLSHEKTSLHLRSLELISESKEKGIEFPHNIVDFHRFKLLRTLILINFKFAGRKLPRGIGNLIHLRTLWLHGCGLDELPLSITNLTNLITLNLLGSWNLRLPNVLNKIARLKSLFLPRYEIEKIGTYRLSLEGLDELEILIGFNSMVHDLQCVTRMTKLTDFRAEVHDTKSLEEIINVVMKSWKHMRCFDIFIEHSCELTQNSIRNLFTCPSLCDVRVLTYTGKLLEACEAHIVTSRLVLLTLAQCRIENDPMKMLGKLPFLEYLSLSVNSFHALGFQKLKKLVLFTLPNVKEWRVERGAMPVVSCIKIGYCLHLEMIPDGLRFILSLNKLKIVGMPILAKRVSTSIADGLEGGDYNKVRHVPSIVIVD